MNEIDIKNIIKELEKEIRKFKYKYKIDIIPDDKDIRTIYIEIFTKKTKELECIDNYIISFLVNEGFSLFKVIVNDKVYGIPNEAVFFKIYYIGDEKNEA